MSNKRRQHSAALKAQVGLEALKNIDPVHAIAAKHKVHPTQVNLWKKEVAERLPCLPAGRRSSSRSRWTPMPWPPRSGSRNSTPRSES